MLTRRGAVAAIYGAGGLACFAEGSSGIIEIPARFNRNKQIMIPAKVNGGTEIWCLLDTGGANLLYLSPPKAAELGVMASSTTLSAGGLDTTSRVGGRALVTLDVGDVHRTRQELYIKELLGHDVAVAGAAVFADFIVELDFQTPALRLHPPALFRYGDHAAPIACDLWSFNPQIPVSLTIDGRDPVKARMTVDSGAAGMADAFVTPRFNDRMRELGRNIPWVADKQGWSTCRIARIAVGPCAMDNPLIVLPPVQGFGGDANAPDGMLAVNFLRRYRLYIDYSKKQAILEQGGQSSTPDDSPSPR